MNPSEIQLTRNDSGTPYKALPLVTLTAFFALASGVFEGAKYATERFMLRRVVLDGAHAVWLPTVFNLVVLGAVSLGLFVFRRLLPTRARPNVAVYVPCFLAFVAVFGKFGWLHAVAVILLAAGVATHVTRWIVRHQARFLSVATPVTAGLGLTVIAAMLSVLLSRRVMERRAMAALPAAPAGAPNVLLVVMDTVRAKNLSLYGYPVPTTPNLELYGRRGVVFDHAVATASWTGPSHASMFTGKYPHEMAVDWFVPLDGAQWTLAEALAEKGYATGGFVANVSQCNSNEGFDQGFVKYADFHLGSTMQTLQACSLGRRAVRAVFSAGRFKVSPEYRWDKPGSMVADDFLEWQAGLEARPFFAFLNFMDAHGPRREGQPEHRGVRPAGPVPEVDPLDPGRELSRKSWLWQINYNARIAYVDQQIGRILEELGRRSVLENTVVIVTSDHGELFGEHSRWSHGLDLYMEAIHVPLLVVFPRYVPAGVRVGEFVTLRDLPATVMSLVGAAVSPVFPGMSLARLWGAVGGAPTASPSPVLSEVSETGCGFCPPDKPGEPRPKRQSLIDSGLHYIVTGSKEELLFDLRRDPLERSSLTRSEERRGDLVEMRTKLRSALTSSALR